MATTPNTPLALAKIRILKRARIIMAKPSHELGVCNAIWQVGRKPDGKLSNRASWDFYANEALRQYINDILGRRSRYLTDWVASGDSTSEQRKAFREVGARKARLMWIDWMIAQLEGLEYKG
jgi:hypothetical protein